MKPTEKLRTFIAIEPDPELQDQLLAITGKFGDMPWAKRIRWLPKNNIHITIRFLGNIEAARVSTISVQIEQALTEIKPFVVSLTAPHLFPSAKRGRIIAALTHEDEQLTALAEKIESAVVIAGVPAESRRFRGHITIGRSRTVIKNFDLGAYSRESMLMNINRIIFYQSILDQSGAQYIPLKTWEL